MKNSSRNEPADASDESHSQDDEAEFDWRVAVQQLPDQRDQLTRQRHVAAINGLHCQQFAMD